MKITWTAEPCECLPGRVDHKLTIDGDPIAFLCDRGNGQFAVGAHGIYGDSQVWIHGNLKQVKREVETDYLTTRVSGHVWRVMHSPCKFWLAVRGVL